MFRVLVIGDPHFETKNLPEAEIFIDKVANVARKTKPHFIVCLGDLLHHHERIYVDPLAKAVKFLTTLANYAKTFLIVGNHERRNNSDFLSDIHPYVGLKDSDNIVIVDKPILHTEMSEDETLVSNFLMCPYVPPGRFKEALNTVKLEQKEGWASQNIDAIFCHQEIRGVQLGAIKSVDGDIWEDDFPTLISGHIHEYNLLKSNVLYVGSPFQQTFSESTNKAVCLFGFNPSFDINNSIPLKEVSSLEELQPSIKYKAKYVRISLGMKVKIVKTIKPSDILKINAKPDQIIKVMIKATAPELKALQQSGNLKHLTMQGIKFKLVPIDERKSKISLNKEVQKKPYLQLFKEIVSNDKDLLPFFINLFGDDV